MDDYTAFHNNCTRAYHSQSQGEKLLQRMRFLLWLTVPNIWISLVMVLICAQLFSFPLDVSNPGNLFLISLIIWSLW